MISIQREDGLIVVGVFGKLGLEDYQRFEHEVLGDIEKGTPVDLLIDLRDMLGVTLDVVWEDIKFSRNHARDVHRVAVLSDGKWPPLSAWLEQLFLHAEVRVFDDEDIARSWLAGDETV
jgi:hypothetical protein